MLVDGSGTGRKISCESTMPTRASSGVLEVQTLFTMFVFHVLASEITAGIAFWELRRKFPESD